MSSYVDEVLLPGETIHYVAHTSFWSLVQEIVAGVVFFLCALVLPLFFPGPGLILSGIFLFVAAMFGLSAWIRYASTELVVTSKRVVAKFGFISRRTIEISLLKVESVQVHQSILGRMFDFGDLTIAGAGTPQAPIPGITDPIEFRRQFAMVQERALKN